MSETDNLIDTLSKMIVGTVDKRLSSADFDKSSQGVVTAKNGDTYTIAVFGGNYNIATDQTFTIGQKVLVTAPQGNMKNLTVSPGNIGNMKTVKEGVRDVNQRLTGIESDYNFALGTFQKLNQNDNQIELWFNTGEPTLTNYPAVNWTTEDAKRDHLEDLYFDKKNSIVYEWMKNGNGYYWEKLENSTITSTLLRASSAQDTADGKRRVFVAQPVPPYDVGDTWNKKITADDAEGKKDPSLIGTYGDTYVCVNPRTITQSFNMSDWTKSSKYTDDTRANEVDKKFDDFKNGEYTNFRKDYDTDFKVLDGKIESKVSSTTYATDKEGIEEAIRANKTSIEQTDDTIKLIASEDDLTNAKNQKKSLMEITSKNITSTVAASEEKTNGQISELSTQISQNKGNINLCVKETDITGDEDSDVKTAIIDMAKDQIELSVADTTNNNSIGSKLKITNESIKSVVGNLYGKDGDKDNPEEGSVIYQLKDEISHRVTNGDMTSAITQKAGEINLEVSKKVGSDEIISKINQTPETITISAKKIDFNGLVTFDKDDNAVGFNPNAVNNSITSISGDTIKTGTLEAEKIKVGSITSKELKAGQVIQNYKEYPLQPNSGTEELKIDNSKYGFTELLIIFKGWYQEYTRTVSGGAHTAQVWNSKLNYNEETGQYDGDWETVHDTNKVTYIYYGATNTMVIPLRNGTTWYHTSFDFPKAYYQHEWEYPSDKDETCHLEELKIYDKEGIGFNKKSAADIMRIFSVDVSDNIITINFKNAVKYSTDSFLWISWEAAKCEPGCAIPWIIYGIK